jgi:ABC-type polar amino acid transport system ATPase subunit
MCCRNVKIGNPLEKGISGGQAKRTNIGIALITSPRVLFLDEPTSGLDSFTANEVMGVVRGLINDGRHLSAELSPTHSFVYHSGRTAMALTFNIIRCIAQAAVYRCPRGLQSSRAGGWWW